MEKVKKIILSKEEQKTLRNYYKIVEEFSEFIDSEMEESAEWITELVLDWAMLDYNPNRKYAGVEFEMEGFER